MKYLTNSLFNDAFFKPLFNTQESVMKTDIHETEDSYVLSIDMPGMDKSHIDMSLKDGYLTVSASNKKEEEESKKNYIRKERFYGTCSRTYYVGEGIKEKDVKAKYADGVLYVSVPKDKEPEEEAAKRIEIE